jgi:hypothetical protein
VDLAALCTQPYIRLEFERDYEAVLETSTNQRALTQLVVALTQLVVALTQLVVALTQSMVALCVIGVNTIQTPNKCK